MTGLLEDANLSSYSLMQLVTLAVGLDPNNSADVYWVTGVVVDDADPATAEPPREDPPADRQATLQVAKLFIRLSEEGLLHLGAETIGRGKRRRGGIANQIGYETSVDLAERDRRICLAFLREIRAGRERGAKSRLARRFSMSAANIGQRIRMFTERWAGPQSRVTAEALEVAIRKSRQV